MARGRVGQGSRAYRRRERLRSVFFVLRFAFGVPLFFARLTDFFLGRRGAADFFGVPLS